MPGREELIQQNISRARASQSAPGSNIGSSPSAPNHRSLMGGNLDVASALNSISFASGPEGDYSMRNSIAFIRRWKRGNSSQVGDSLSNAFSFPSVDSWQNISSNVADLFGGNINLPSEYTFNNLPDFSSSQTKFRPGAFSGSIPSTLDTSSVLRNISFSGNRNGTSPYNNPTNFIGQAKSANPWGYFNRFFGNFLSGLTGSTVYSGKIGQSTQARYGGGTVGKVGGGGTLPEGIWQFLFNPSELELSVGPEFKNSEVWGVSDRENSGQPLHWSNNKNPELKFSSIVLNGYIFGKQVEELEQGIIDLFMSRDGDGDDGPPVLEFVWGDKVFGPCLIKDITIKEKMWDAGKVVNAELSFTLVQIPEWTINDGFVDVARPGRAAPIASSGGTSSSTSTSTQPSTPPGGGSNPDQKAKDTNSLPSITDSPDLFPQSECDAARRTQANLNNLLKSGQLDTGFWEWARGSVSGNRASIGVSKYATIYDSFASQLSKFNISPECKNKCAYRGQAFNNNRDLACARDCSKALANALARKYSSTKCPAATLLQR